MGKVGGGSGEGLSGLIGNVIFYSYNGETYFRTAHKKRSKKSWSESQVLNRKRFAAIKAFWRQYGKLSIKEIWQVADAKTRGDNLFVRINSRAFGPDGTLVDPQLLHFSAGRLPLPHRFVAARTTGDPQEVEVSWVIDPVRGLGREDDQLMMMVAHEGKFKGPIATGAVRRQETAVIQLPSDIGTVQGIYLFFASGERNLYSEDLYFGL